MDKKHVGNHSGSWVHPDLAVHLTQWISPVFALQVARWVRELAIRIGREKTSVTTLVGF